MSTKLYISHHPVKGIITRALTFPNQYSPNLIKNVLDILESYSIVIGNEFNFSDSITPNWFSSNLDINITLSKFSKLDTPSHIIRKHYSKLLELYPNYIQCFTDGSKIGQNHVGYAFSISDEFYSYKLNKISSIFTAEILAVFHCLHHISTNLSHYPSKNFVIITDSLASLTSLKKVFPTNLVSKHMQSLTHKLFLLQSNIKFIYAPSHIGILGNDKVDSLAKSSALESPFNFPLISDLHSLIEKHIQNNWQTEWQGSQQKLGAIKKSVLPWKNFAFTNRSEEVAITRLRIGHSRITHKHLFQKNFDPPE